MIRKLLIANRGEIACRVIRTAKRLGISTVAVYSDADRGARHVIDADEAIHIGAAPARESYLDAGKFLQAAKDTACDAVHPGYGFLSENAGFARACADAGILFVGPPASAIDAMGSKSAAKTIMENAGVPLVPGYHGTDQDNATLRAHADDMGYPVLLKAAAGGGGKGMRVVENSADFNAACDAARREAKSSFGDETLLVEKYLLQPRHVEIQIFCDNHGNSVYLGERDCSLQRRHQKVIEEAPAPGMTVALRAAMGEAAVRSAEAIGYRGAGTVEFLLDTDGQFYFMEMNTRLQVEHPVTEMITGQDLVAWQLSVVAGEALPLSQDQVRLQGHAFEARIYAEDPDKDFLPSTGIIDHLQTPDDASVRIDSGVAQGDEISVYYDPMIAKVIVHGPTRQSALGKLRRALAGYRITGLPTNRDFLLACAAHPAFAEADIDTGFIPRHLPELLTGPDRTELLMLAALFHFAGARHHPSHQDNPWQRGDDWRLSGRFTTVLEVQHGESVSAVSLSRTARSKTVCVVTGEQNVEAEIEMIDAEQALITLDGHQQRVTVLNDGAGQTLYCGEQSLRFTVIDRGAHQDSAEDEQGSLTAPMNGTVIALLVNAGVDVKRGTPLLVMEAMKMEHTLNAPADGQVSEFFANVGDLVSGGAQLMHFEEAGA